MTSPLIDIGINLMHKQFAADREQVLKRAIDVGVKQLVITGTSERASQEASTYASKYAGTLYSTAGVHPHDAKSCTPKTIETLRQLAQRDEVVAIGECGLDYNRDFSPRPVQDQWFEEQIKLAIDLNMPLFLHERDAHQRFIEILGKYKTNLPKAVVHCFTGNQYEMDRYLRMGMYIGITGWINDERRGKHLRDLVKRIPMNRLMLETDAPFLAPKDMQPPAPNGRNEPAFLLHVLNAVAKAMGKSPEEVAVGTTETSREFFGL